MNNPPLEGIATNLAGYGRYGDSQLVHMNPAEVQGIASLVPGGKLTINPVTGQPEAFLPFLIPLLSQFAPALFTSLAAPLAGASGLAGALGTGLSFLGSHAAIGSAVASGAMEAARTGDIKKGLMSGLTSYGLGKALGGAKDIIAGVPEATTSAADAARAAMEGSAGTMTAEQISKLPASGELLKAQARADMPFKEIFSGKDGLMGGAKALTKGLTSSGAMIPIAVGEGQRAQMEADEELALIAAQREEDKRQDYLRAQGIMGESFAELESGYPGYTLAGGGIISLNPSDYMARRNGFAQLSNEPVRMQRGGPFPQGFPYSGGGTDDVFRYNFGPGGAASRQAGIRGSRVITPEELALEGRPGFGPEIQYFRAPIADGVPPGSPPPPPPPGPGPGPGTPGKGNNAGGDLPPSVIDYLAGLERGSEARDVFGPPEDVGAAPPGEVPPPARAPSRGGSVLGMGRMPGGEPPMDVGGMGMPEGPPSGSIEDVIGAIQAPQPAAAMPPIVPPAPPPMAAPLGELPMVMPPMPPPPMMGPLPPMPPPAAMPPPMAAPPAPPPMAAPPSPVVAPAPTPRMPVTPPKATGIAALPPARQEGESQADFNARMETWLGTQPGMDRRSPRGPGMAVGGMTDPSADPATLLIEQTMMAVLGQLSEEEAEVIIAQFISEFGEEAFQMLREQALQSVVPGAQTEGMIQGPGGGMDDQVQGMIGSEQPVAVSPGEFIVPADVVSGLGDGSSDAGAAKLDGMMDEVRVAKTGGLMQPRQISNRVIPS